MNAILGSYELLRLELKVIIHHDAIPKLMAPTHCSHFGDTRLCVATCRLVGYYPLFPFVAMKLKAMKDQPQTKIFRPQAPIAARRLIFVAHEKGWQEMMAALHILRASTHPYRLGWF